MLQKHQYNNIIRLARRADIGTVNQLRHVTFHKLSALGAKRDLSKAVTHTPKGSDQVDVRSVLEWIDKIQPDHKRAIWQLIAFDATLVSRD